MKIFEKVAAIASCVLLLLSCNHTANERYEQYVNPLVGSDIRVVEGKDKNSTEERGQTMPAVGVPHGMTNWVAQTQRGENKCDPPYYYFHDKIQGFRASHWMNGSCTQDYGSVTIMPIQGELKTDADKRSSVFIHEKEVATPSYYKVALDDYKIVAEITGLSRTGLMQFSFGENTGFGRYIIIEPNSDEGEAYVAIDTLNNEIVGYNPVHRIYQGLGENAGFSGHFVIKINSEITEFGTWTNDSITRGKSSIKNEGNNIGLWVKLGSSTSTVKVKVGTSFTSMENARKNMLAEIPDWDFQSVRDKSSDIWESTLSKIKVETEDREKKVKFYTALYNTHFLPRTFSDVDGSYPSFDKNDKIQNAGQSTYYCDFSMWDTYRAVHPLFTILDEKKTSDMVNSLLLKAEQGGWLPIFPAWNSYTAAMIGDHCISMIGDAIVKDVQGVDYEKAYRIMRKNAFEINTDSVSYKDGKGRRALESYLKYNYIPLEDKVPHAFHTQEQVSRTLEYAYDDFVLAQVAKKLGKSDDFDKLIKRAANYKNVIDPSVGYARGRYADGRWIESFDPNAFLFYICEGTPYHYTWYVPQDIAGLIEHIGGEKIFEERLDQFFEEGRYWHGNEPCHHVAYLFNYVGKPWKAQKWINQIIDSEYHNAPDGLSGNDDAGQMSAWLVFSMMGFYPVCPGMPYYVIGTPSFDKVSIEVANEKKFQVEAKKLSNENIYIQSATLNGKPYSKSYIEHSDIMKGGVLTFEMGSRPNYEWADSVQSIPYSMK